MRKKKKKNAQQRKILYIRRLKIYKNFLFCEKYANRLVLCNSMFVIAKLISLTIVGFPEYGAFLIHVLIQFAGFRLVCARFPCKGKNPNRHLRSAMIPG